MQLHAYNNIYGLLQKVDFKVNFNSRKCLKQFKKNQNRKKKINIGKIPYDGNLGSFTQKNINTWIHKL